MTPTEYDIIMMKECIQKLIYYFLKNNLKTLQIDIFDSISKSKFNKFGIEMLTNPKSTVSKNLENLQIAISKININNINISIQKNQLIIKQVTT